MKFDVVSTFLRHVFGLTIECTNTKIFTINIYVWSLMTNTNIGNHVIIWKDMIHDACTILQNLLVHFFNNAYRWVIASFAFIKFTYLNGYLTSKTIPISDFCWVEEEQQVYLSQINRRRFGMFIKHLKIH